MAFRRFLAAGLVVCGAGLMAGCPQIGGLVDSVLSDVSDLASEFAADEAFGDVPDGTYAGTKSATTKYWEDGVPFWSGDWNESVAATFYDSALVASSGYWVEEGDVDSLDMGSLQISREVYEVNVFDWGFEVLYDLSATWSGVPLAGEQHVDFVTEADGSVTLYDTIELTSANDGGTWEILIEAEGTLTPSGGVGNPVIPNDPGSPLDDDILDKKSGKIRR